MIHLAYVQFFSNFSMWIYTTPTVTENQILQIQPQKQYNDGADWLGFIPLYNGVAAILQFLICRY
jgi:hypothetical protein